MLKASSCLGCQGLSSAGRLYGINKAGFQGFQSLEYVNRI